MRSRRSPALRALLWALALAGCAPGWATTYERFISERLTRGDRQALARLVQQLEPGASVESVRVRWVGHPADWPAIDVRLVPRRLGGREVELRRLLVDHAGWLRRIGGQPSCPPGRGLGPFCARRGLDRCRAFELSTSYRTAGRPLLICVAGETTQDEAEELLHRLEWRDFTSQPGAQAPRFALADISQLRCQRGADELRWTVTVSTQDYQWSVLHFVWRWSGLHLQSSVTIVS